MLLKITDLNQAYDQSRTLWGLNLTIESGNCMGLIGRNGVGKTTFLSCVMGLIKPTSGMMRYQDVDLIKTPPEARAGLGIGYVPQGRMIFPLLTVEENLRIGLGAVGGKHDSIPEQVFDLFPALKTMLSPARRRFIRRAAAAASHRPGTCARTETFNS